MEKSMSNERAVSVLRNMEQGFKDLVNQIKLEDERAQRPSEKAMAIATYENGICALGIAIAALSRE